MRAKHEKIKATLIELFKTVDLENPEPGKNYYLVVSPEYPTRNAGLSIKAISPINFSMFSDLYIELPKDMDSVIEEMEDFLGTFLQ